MADSALLLLAVDRLALALVASVMLMIVIRRLADAIALVCVQAVLLAAVGVAIALTGAEHVWTAVGLTIAVKAILVPAILGWVLIRLRVRQEIEAVVPMPFALAGAVGLVLVAYSVVREVQLPGGFATPNALPAAIGLMLLGFYQMVTRKKALSQVIGLITMENGLYLVALVTTAGLPLVVELGVFFDLLAGVFVMGLFAYRINQTYDSINTDRLSRLRG